MKSLFQQFDRVADFPHTQRGRVDHAEDGTTIVRIYDPRETRPEYTTDAFKLWENIPGLKEVAIRAFIKEVTNKNVTSHMSRKHYAGLFQALAELLVSAGLDDRSPETLTYYDCEDVISHIASMEITNPHHRLIPLRLIVSEIWASAEYDGKRDPHLYVRKAPFPGSGLRGGKREVLDDALWGDIIAKAATEVGRIMTDVEAFRTALDQRITSVGRTPKSLQSPVDCAVWAYRSFGPNLPHFSTIREAHPSYARAIIRAAGGWKEVVRLIHPTLPSLMPFLALFGCYTLFNKGVLAEFSLKDVDFTEIGGSRRIVFTPLKRRAGKKQLRSFAIDDMPDHPDVMFRFLQTYTKDLRNMVDGVFKERLFLFWTLAARKDEKPGASAFTGVQTGTGAEDSRFTYYWGEWCKEIGAAETVFSSLRITGLNLAHRAFAGDVRAIAALASHSSLEIFDHHYKSAHSRARNDRRIGKAMLLRERMLASNGKIDPTRRLRGEGVQAATPGFGCLDPVSSPMPGQREGRPCTAYGQCPDCPLATTDTRVPANLVRIKQMEAEYVEAVNYLAPHYWRDKYSQHLAALRMEWLPAFTEDRVIKEATRMQVQPLPPLG